MISALLAQALPWILALLTGFGIVVGARASGRREARQEEELRRAREASATRERMDDAVDRYRRHGGADGGLRRGDF